MLTLVIANKNYSSWSLRPWLAMTEAGIPFAEHMVKFDSAEWESDIGRLSPTGLVPVLWEETPGDGFCTFDTIAILERLHELHPDKAVWPKDACARSRARSLAATFHSGFQALRSAMPMNIRSSHPGKGMSDAVRAEIDRLLALWQQTKAEFGRDGRFLFGDYTAADAYFAPVASRFETYAVRLDNDAREYQQALLQTQGMKAWTKAALKETEFVAEDEPYHNRTVDSSNA